MLVTNMHMLEWPAHVGIELRHQKNGRLILHALNHSLTSLEEGVHDPSTIIKSLNKNAIN